MKEQTYNFTRCPDCNLIGRECDYIFPLLISFLASLKHSYSLIYFFIPLLDAFLASDHLHIQYTELRFKPRLWPNFTHRQMCREEWVSLRETSPQWFHAVLFWQTFFSTRFYSGCQTEWVKQNAFKSKSVTMLFLKQFYCEAEWISRCISEFYHKGALKSLFLCSTLHYKQLHYKQASD